MVAAYQNAAYSLAALWHDKGEELFALRIGRELMMPFRPQSL